ncbi:hypothetical protein [Paenibacillus alvei]|uniref:hypothetical protein n=1 Tax=Paenibacillus alvei TaxID=44250 RepID=UPI0018CFEAC4|nr:hypothetical protein [Paenibacillus alvei]MCY9580708.1 hypothetical protein [Paenibacillus alvei]MCY9585191.1 hypothetical protein [Paenibacillus alvei]
MNICFYDNSELKDEPIVHIDRVYCLDFSQFTNDSWDRLAEIYSLLPSQICIHHIGQPCWFGEEGKTDYFLWASVEPSGLQIAGILKSSDWNEWECKFNELVAVFPLFEC